MHRGLVDGFSAGLRARLYGRQDACRYKSFARSMY
jgi:hypothetical protein